MTDKTSSSDNLWPEDLVSDKIRAPLSILREQGKHLARQTGGAVQGEVRVQMNFEFAEISFQLKVPALGGYRYDLFSLYYKPDELYPLGGRFEELEWDLDAEATGRSIRDEEDLKRALQKVFGHKKTRNVVNTLIAQAADPEARPPRRSDAFLDVDDRPF